MVDALPLAEPFRQFPQKLLVPKICGVGLKNLRHNSSSNVNPWELRIYLQPKSCGCLRPLVGADARLSGRYDELFFEF